ncbi:MAG: hypothetical protein H6741_28150 [Alphaproteobacteria bacterium]|nr:hypothetical protein [Alphaproteobacteria bacterium]MCB9796588.1 hypothetical protein [Alphaproteobacteria bacterium]
MHRSTSLPEGSSARRITYRGRRIDCIEHKSQHELRIDGVAVPVYAWGPERFSSWALPGGTYPSLEALGRAVTRAYFGVTRRAASEELVDDDFELPE